MIGDYECGTDALLFRFFVFFFFKQKTAYEILTCDWSSDVCSSDLTILELCSSSMPVGGIICL